MGWLTVDALRLSVAFTVSCVVALRDGRPGNCVRRDRGRPQLGCAVEEFDFAHGAVEVDRFGR